MPTFKEYFAKAAEHEAEWNKKTTALSAKLTRWYNESTKHEHPAGRWEREYGVPVLYVVEEQLGVAEARSLARWILSFDVGDDSE